MPPAPPNDSPEGVLAHFNALTARASHLICHFTANQIRNEKRTAQGLQRELRTIYSTPADNDDHATHLSLLEKKYQRELSALHQTQTYRQTSFINRVADVDAPVANYYAQARATRKLSAADRVVPELLHPITGFAQTDTIGKLEAAHIFYSRLFQRPVEGPIFTHPNDTRDSTPLPDVSTTEYNSLFHNLPQLSQEQQDALLAPPTLEVALALLRRLKPHKAPGADGLGNDFFRIYAEELAPHFLTVLTAFHNTGYIPPSTKKGIVTPFYKGTGERANLQNWRPITLLNTTYKLLALYLGTKLNPILSTLISPGQTSCVPGRTCASNVHAVSLAMAAATESDYSEATFLFLDSEKAFDNVKWSFLWDTLKGFGLPPTSFTCARPYTKTPLYK